MKTPTLSTPLVRSRTVERLVRGQQTSDGDGVKLTRVLTQPLQQRLDPFLMLDAFGSDAADDYVGGFPDHPHRGFETVTYMLAGRMRHRDSAGNMGLLEPGSVQWMTAGRGLVHSEMPEQESGLMEGFQLWVNLASQDKMQAPQYRDVPPDAIPDYALDNGVKVRVIAGASHGVEGAVQRPRTEPIYLDIELPPGADFEAQIPPAHNAFVYVFRGEASVGGPPDDAHSGARVPLQSMGILGNDPASDGVRLAAPADLDKPARVLVIAGHPLKEPIVQYGPFVMNSPEQIHQALADFRAGAIAR
jgi:redox-sensitive bicupin YhaK (pirin superfamily)